MHKLLERERYVLIRQFQTNHLFNGFFSLSYKQAGRNKLDMFIWSCVLVYRETGVYWDLVYKDKQQYTEDIQAVKIGQGNLLNK